MKESIFLTFTTEQIKNNIKNNITDLKIYIKHYEKTHFKRFSKKDTRTFHKSNISELSLILSKYSNLDKDKIKELLDLKIFYRPEIIKLLELKDLN